MVQQRGPCTLDQRHFCTRRTNVSYFENHPPADVPKRLHDTSPSAGSFIELKTSRKTSLGDLVLILCFQIPSPPRPSSFWRACSKFVQVLLEISMARRIFGGLSHNLRALHKVSPVRVSIMFGAAPPPT